MRMSFLGYLLSSYLFSSLPTFAMEENTRQLESPLYSHLCIPSHPTTDISTIEILGRNFAYGFIESTIQESCHSFEIVLHNLLITKGTHGAAAVFQTLGGVAGDQATKLAINMSVQMLIDAATGPIGVPGMFSKTTKALVLLDGILARLIINRIQSSIDDLKDQITCCVAAQTSKTVYSCLEPYAENDSQKGLLHVGSLVAGHGAGYLSHHALDHFTEQLYGCARDQVLEFVATSDLTKDYEEWIRPAFLFLTEGTGYYLNDATQMLIFATYPLAEVKYHLEVASKAEANKSLWFLRTAGSYLGSAGGYFVGKVIGNYAAHEAADAYIEGVGEKLSASMLQCEALKRLGAYRGLSIQDYQKIYHYEHEQQKLKVMQAEKQALRCQLEEDQRREEIAIKDLYTQTVLAEHKALVDQEHAYDEGYQDQYQDKGGDLWQYLGSPLTYVGSGLTNGIVTAGAGALYGIQEIGSAVYYAPQALYQAGANLVEATASYGNALVQWGASKTSENLTPEMTYTFGQDMGRKTIDTALLMAFAQQGYSMEAAVALLKVKQDKGFYYTMGKCGYTIGAYGCKSAYMLGKGTYLVSRGFYEYVDEYMQNEIAMIGE